MQTLHIITPSSYATSVSCLNLMQMTIKHLAGSHQVLVIGDERDATDIRARDIPVLGSIDGPLNASRTLDRRVKTIVDKAAKLNMSMRIFAWGWHGAAVASSFGNNYKSEACCS